MLISADQIRAARALKNWSQTDLAERTGLAVPTIANIELGKQIPGKNTIEKIIDAFQISGIRFTLNGVEFDKNEIITVVGDGKFKNILFDAIRVLETIPPKQREFLMYSADDTRSTEEEISLYEEMKEKGITYKRIVSDKARELHHRYHSKEIEHKYFDEKGAVFVFHDRVGFYTAKEDLSQATTHIITNERIAETYKKIFAYMWDNLPETKAKIKTQKKGRK